MHTMSLRATTGRLIGVVLAAIAAALVLVVAPQQAAAHTDLESSVPAADSTLDEPVTEVVLVFSVEATPIDDGFVALNAAGQRQAPVSFDTDDNRTYRLQFGPPLAGGAVGIGFTLRAADGHTIEEAFSFTVTAPLPTTTTSTTTTTAAPPVTAPPATGVPDSAVTTAPPTTAATSSSVPAPSSTDVAEVAADTAATESLDEFLALDDSSPGETTALVGRMISFVALAVALGSIAFAATAMRADRSEFRGVLTGAGVAAGVLVVGAVVEYVGVTRVGDDSFLGAALDTPGTSPALRVLGGLAVALGAYGAISVLGGANPRSRLSLSAAVADDVVGTTERPASGRGMSRWAPSGVVAGLLGVGAFAVVASFWFDGHTVTEGPRVVHAIADTLHVVAGVVWVGGVVTLCALAWARHRSGAPSGVAEMVVRFSRIATVALVGVVVAGGAMTAMILESPGDLTSTDWGRTLLIKTGAVAVAVAMGAYNHFRLVPAVEKMPADDALRSRVRTSLTVEAGVLLVVVLVTAVLVAASTA